ncbi:MAG: hypothetical protein RL148_3220 [Planctomycetota bacterium]
MRELLRFGVFFPLVLCVHALGQEATGWQRPPEPIARLVDAEPLPTVGLSPCRRWLVMAHREGMPSIEVQARVHRKLAGLRIDPLVQGPQLGARTTRIVLRSVADGTEWVLPLGEGHWLGTEWSADGAWVAAPRATDKGIELWLVDVEKRAATLVPGVRLNAVLGDPVRWMPDQRTLLCTLSLGGSEPPAPKAPTGPVVQENRGTKAQVRTFQDLLQDDHDAALFDFHATSQLALVDLAGAVTKVGAPARVASTAPSPDGSLLLVSTVDKPFSYLVPVSSFPRRTAVWDLQGRTVQQVAEQPLQETVPIGGVPTGPRGVRWLPSQPRTLVWTEALDGGDPKAKVALRDAVRTCVAGAEPVDWLRTEHRAQGLQFGEDGVLALLTEFDRNTRRQRTWRLDAVDRAKAPQLLLERSTQDAYGDPGQPVVRTDARGRTFLRQDGTAVYLAGQGATKDGDLPFLDRWDLATNEKQRLFQCADGRYETFVAFLDADGSRILVGSESPKEPRNSFAVDLANPDRSRWQQLTTFVDPAAELTAKVQKILLRYQRADGVPLSGTLYLPPDWQPGRKLPVLVWAYPQEFNQASDAGQVRGSPNRYVRLGGTSHLWLLLAGYAVLDDAAMPIVGPVRTANDTFVQQLTWNAEAAVEALVAHGVGERGNMAVAGHSYGAFMTANLLCHTDLFATGIARSGAYNRTLTPFGFQNEERTYWEAPEVYQAMSPFANAHKVNEPILLVHGEDDNNPGTFPVQSQRFYAAVKGHGGTARLVMLPHESHGYAARESVQHCLHEMVRWLDQYLRKPAD